MVYQSPAQTYLFFYQRDITLIGMSFHQWDNPNYIIYASFGLGLAKWDLQEFTSELLRKIGHVIGVAQRDKLGAYGNYI